MRALASSPDLIRRRARLASMARGPYGFHGSACSAAVALSTVRHCTEVLSPPGSLQHAWR
eukprot:7387209-Lingulodinium_polyedra.AAC.1